MALPSASLPSNNTKGNPSALDAFFLAQQQQQSNANASLLAAKKTQYTQRTLRRAASRAATTTTTSSSRLSPNGSGHSSLPSVQIDPLLEQISLTVTAVSLQPLSGNQVVRHIRTKTDDVITRFLPCVDFLVNCQQELRQGLQLAQRSRSRTHGRSRGGGGMTPRQFHAAYVQPLPKRFERHNESIMAREHLRGAKVALETLVRDSHACVPQGCDHVKNAFLGGMRENESWGLRKWLSKHGGAGSICNDLEEVIRHVKGLKKEDETTKRLAEMLRPIARQAHERLKKDVPQAYQEQSSAHPYLPFFHRLEACLKQMATYDPEEDEVICLDSSDDEEEEEDVKVVVPKIESAPVAAAAKSSAVKKRVTRSSKPPQTRPSKRKSENDGMSAISKYLDNYSDGTDAKRSRPNTNDLLAESFLKEDEDKKPTAKGEPEIICVDESDDEDDDENDESAADAGGQDNLGQSLSPLPAAAIGSPVEEYTTTLQQNASINDANGYQQNLATTESDEVGATGGDEEWRCSQCTFLNEAFSSKCVMCNDDDSAEGENTTDDLANFLGGSSFLEPSISTHSFAAPTHSVQSPSGVGGNILQQQQQTGALQSADARELECLAEHISSGGSLPKQAHHNIDAFWGTMDTFPQILLLFRTILQHPMSHRFLETVNESHLFMIGLPPYSSIVRHPKICFHRIVSALSRSEDAVKYPHLTMRLSNGQLNNDDESDELEDWNMWNGLHLIEAIDLVMLNSLAYNANRGGSSHQIQLQTETESLRNVLWEGVNSILTERLQPHERRDHFPQQRSADSGFVVVDYEGR